MKTVIYEFVDGTKNEVEVSDELAAVIAELDNDIKNNDQNETRRHISLERLAERKDTEVRDENINFEAGLIKDVEIETLRNAMETLMPKQRELLQKIFFEKQSLTAVAEEYGVSPQAIENRLNKIYEKLRYKLHRKLRNRD